MRSLQQVWCEDTPSGEAVGSTGSTRHCWQGRLGAGGTLAGFGNILICLITGNSVGKRKAKKDPWASSNRDLYRTEVAENNRQI